MAADEEGLEEGEPEVRWLKARTETEADGLRVLDGGSDLEADPEIVALLEELLADAEAGQIGAIAVATLSGEGGTGTYFLADGTREAFQLLGVTSQVQYRLAAWLDANA